MSRHRGKARPHGRPRESVSRDDDLLIGALDGRAEVDGRRVYFVDFFSVTTTPFATFTL